ncbi:MAG TPA: ABC transporter ATP-binding protein [Phycisphaerae bacterium]|nr:ABC transporter ATP-binding protein [Phycisphaerae bacterium]HRW55559.1 ABC transporter ATP-binding protein [Phycisphaerae bacterium]
MNSRASTTLTAERVRYSFDGRRDFLIDVSLSASAGACWGIVGPNGAGKSTLLRMLAGLARPADGAVSLDGVSLSGMSAVERARRIAYLPQRVPVTPGMTAGQVVLLGRYPHRGFGLFESAQDIAIARDAMTLTETIGFIDRSVASLSGGEAQRVHLAAAIAQAPDILLLDEPTTALDWRHQIAIFDILRRMADERRVAVVVVTHDLNLAGRYCDGVLLMRGGRVVCSGPTIDVLRPEVLSPVFEVSVRAIDIEGRSVAMLAPSDALPLAADRGKVE